jgi:hypothetical protein
MQAVKLLLGMNSSSNHVGTWWTVNTVKSRHHQQKMHNLETHHLAAAAAAAAADVGGPAGMQCSAVLEKVRN